MNVRDRRGRPRRRRHAGNKPLQQGRLADPVLSRNRDALRSLDDDRAPVAPRELGDPLAWRDGRVGKVDAKAVVITDA